ncbi:MAG: hypothetical protein FJW23_00895 [Acidimicrobiia bacterium]|nr:hypothetical protein [Acidimicrobiia bacterium]
MAGQRTRLAVLAGVFTLLAAAPGRAQDAMLGVQAGAGPTYLTVPESIARSLGPGVTGGVFGVVPIISTIGIQGEARYTLRRSSLSAPAGVPVRTGDVTLHYLSVPVLARVRLFGDIYLVEGPAFHFPIRGRLGGVDITDDLQTDLTFVVGIGRRGERYSFEGRWESGMRFTRRVLLPGDVPTRNRALTGLMSVRLK